VQSSWVYILKCSDESYYTGLTNDIESRIAEHREAIDPRSYTARRLPLKLVYATEFQDINDAQEFEWQVKKWNRAKKEALIEGDLRKLRILSNHNNTKNSFWVKFNSQLLKNDK